MDLKVLLYNKVKLSDDGLYFLNPISIEEGELEISNDSDSLGFIITCKDLKFNGYNRFYRTTHDIQSNVPAYGYPSIEQSSNYINGINYNDIIVEMVSISDEKNEDAYLKSLKQKVRFGRTNLDNVFYDVIELSVDKFNEFFYTENVISQEMYLEIDASLKDLNELIGLDSVKNRVFELLSFLEYMNKVKDFTNLEYPNLNMAFLGNPGTGKTTVARIIAKLLYKMGYIDTPIFRETSARAFIGEHIGETAIKAKNFIQDNRGGIIFIDEAYTLATVSGKENVFAQEAVAEILLAMEKREAIFIFAGYYKEMDAFLNMNSGILSRIGLFLDFKDYSLDELLLMLKFKIDKSGLRATDEFYLTIKSKIEEASKQENFGNGRFIDKLFYQVLLNHSVNLKGEDDLDLLLCINKNDISNDILDSIIYTDKIVEFQKNKKI